MQSRVHVMHCRDNWPFIMQLLVGMQSYVLQDHMRITAYVPCSAGQINRGHVVRIAKSTNASVWLTFGLTLITLNRKVQHD